MVFFLVIIAFAIISRLLNFAFKLPGLRLLNSLGGAAFGLIFGVAIVFAGAWIIHYMGMLIPEETVEKTVLLKFFMNTNPLAFIFGT
jgi:hypothetical protein